MKKLIGLMIMASLTLVSCDKTVSSKTEDSVAKTEDSAAAAAEAEVKGGMDAYKRASIASEAKTNLKMIADGAMAYYEAEHMADPEGLTVFSKKYPESTGVQLGPDVNENTINKKYTPAPDDYDEVWKKLYFQISGEAYYTYYYISDGKTARVKAVASLEKACDSIFEITLQEGPMAGVIVDRSDSGDCGPAKL